MNAEINGRAEDNPGITWAPYARFKTNHPVAYLVCVFVTTTFAAVVITTTATTVSNNMLRKVGLPTN